MNTTIKTPVTQVIAYITYKDKNKQGENHSYMMYGTPNKTTIKNAIKNIILNDKIKKIKIVDTIKHNLEIYITSAFLVKTVDDLIIEFAKNKFNFECTIID